MYSIESQLKGVMKQHGFVIAAELIDLRGFSKKKIHDMINSWRNFPKSMDIFPKVLSEKVYNDATQEYTIKV